MINRENYKVVKEYLSYQADVLQRDPLTVHNSRMWLNHLLRWADEKPFVNASNLRPVYPRYLLTVSTSHDKKLASVGIKRGCQTARTFFNWARQNRTEFRKLPANWVETIQPVRMGVEPRQEHKAVTLEMVRALLAVPEDDLTTWRDKAAAAFLFLSGARASAFCTLTLGCVNIEERTVIQYPTLGVRTKNKKAAITRLLEIPDLLAEVKAWDDYIRPQLASTACWYTVIDGSFGNLKLTAERPGRFRMTGLDNNLSKLFKKAGLPLMSPHKFRHGHAVYALKLTKDVADLKAVSMNLMHSSIGITDSIYAVLSDRDMQDRIARLGQGRGAENEGLSDVAMVNVMRQYLAKLDAREAMSVRTGAT